MEKLIKQIVKFGIVGVFATLLDIGLYTIFINVGIYYVTASIISFSISLIFNYILSMKFVFVPSPKLSKQKRFIIFAILSIIGGTLNSLILYLIVDIIYLQNEALIAIMTQKIAKVIAKVLATGITMVYNFITKKIFLEERN